MSVVGWWVPITYELPEPEKKSWFSPAPGSRAARTAGFTWQVSRSNAGWYPRLASALLAL
ncbi:Uncharacterised protein [Mycobacterium tuberculosis]|nr:Uncharacterised protein [Mycobacterium tuberculosis]